MDATRVVEWLSSSGKVWLLRIVALALSAFSLLSTFDVISKTYLKPEFIYPAIFLLLWLMFELFLSLLTADLKRDRSPVALLPWNEAIPEIVAAARRTKSTLRILGSSTESLYIPLKETLEHLSNVKIELILRRSNSDDNTRLTKLSQYHSYWLGLSSQERSVKVEIKYSSNDTLRAVMVDSSEGFLGFYEKRDDKLWGHTVPLMHVRRGTTIGDHMIHVYQNRFEQMWRDACDWVPNKGRVNETAGVGNNRRHRTAGAGSRKETT